MRFKVKHRPESTLMFAVYNVSMCLLKYTSANSNRRLPQWATGRPLNSGGRGLGNKRYEELLSVQSHDEDLQVDW